mgnify:CR=1 FL=1
MALWGKTDASGSKPKYLTDAQKEKAVFVSVEEALLGTNKAKGITGAGWWLLDEYTGSNGDTRYKAEHLVAISVLNAISGDAADDAKVSDVEVAITIQTQPDPTAYYYDQALTLSVVASVNVGTLTYQWQQKLPAEGSRWTNIADATSDSYTTPVLVEADNGTQYRVVLGSSSGAKKVYSDAAVAIFD